MKRYLFVLILGMVSLNNFSQRSEENVFNLKQGHINVYLIKEPITTGINGPPNAVVTTLVVNCRVICPKLLLPVSSGIFFHDNYATLSMDTLFQELYDWISKIKDFAENQSQDTLEWIEPYYYHTILTHGNSCVKILSQKYISDDENQPREAHCYLLIDKVNYKYYILARLKFKTIVEFQKRLVEYTKVHNINIKFQTHKPA